VIILGILYSKVCAYNNRVNSREASALRKHNKITDGKKNATVADEQCTKGVKLGTKKMDWRPAELFTEIHTKKFQTSLLLTL
jgi:hypothetical protein